MAIVLKGWVPEEIKTEQPLFSPDEFKISLYKKIIILFYQLDIRVSGN